MTAGGYKSLLRDQLQPAAEASPSYAAISRRFIQVKEYYLNDFIANGSIAGIDRHDLEVFDSMSTFTFHNHRMAVQGAIAHLSGESPAGCSGRTEHPTTNTGP